MLRTLRMCIALAAAAVLAGCASPPALAPSDIVDEISCESVDAFSDAPDLARGRVPDGFVPVAVVDCLPFQSVEDDAGIWSVVGRERLEGDLAPLLALQAAPDDPRSLGPCAAIQTIPPQIWLTDAGGRGILLRIPVDGCGQPKVDLVTDALAGLTVVRTDEEQRTLVQPREALESGCAPTWAARPLQLMSPEGLDASPAPRPSPSDGIQTIPGPAPRTPAPGEVDELLLCAYSTADAAAPTSTPAPGATAWATVRADDTAWFTGSRRLDATQTRAVLAAAASAQPLPSPCDEIPGSLVVLDAGDGTAPITVELDGCRRLVVDDVRTYAAPAALVELLAG